MTIIMCRELKHALKNNNYYRFSFRRNTKIRVKQFYQSLGITHNEFHTVPIVYRSTVNSDYKNSSHSNGAQDVDKEEIFYNPCGIQMISKSVYQQTFKNVTKRNETSKEVLAKIEKHLMSHDLWGKSIPAAPNLNLKLPPLCGKNLDEHFRKVADKQSKGYLDSLTQLISRPVPSIPTFWQFTPGWTQYDGEGNFTSVDYPQEEAYIFDVEVCVTEGHLPTLATAVSNKYWYSWCSDQLYYQKVFRSSTRCEKQSDTRSKLFFPINFRTAKPNQQTWIHITQ